MIPILKWNAIIRAIKLSKMTQIQEETAAEQQTALMILNTEMFNLNVSFGISVGNCFKVEFLL